MAADPLDDLRRVLRQPDRRSWRRHLVGREAPEPAPGPTPLLDRLAPGPPVGADPVAGDRALDGDTETGVGRVRRRPAGVVRIVVSAVAMGVVLVLASALRPDATSRPPDVDDHPVIALQGDDLDRPAPTTTAAVRLWPAEPVVVEGREVRSDGRRWEVGADGDVVTVGDWDCDRVPTPAVLRPSTGGLSVFDRWAATDRPEVARPVTTVPGAVTVRAAAACGTATVVTADGAERTVDTRGSS